MPTFCANLCSSTFPEPSPIANPMREPPLTESKVFRLPSLSIIHEPCAVHASDEPDNIYHADPAFRPCTLYQLKRPLMKYALPYPICSSAPITNLIRIMFPCSIISSLPWPSSVPQVHNTVQSTIPTLHPFYRSLKWTKTKRDHPSTTLIGIQNRRQPGRGDVGIVLAGPQAYPRFIWIKRWIWEQTSWP